MREDLRRTILGRTWINIAFGLTFAMLVCLILVHELSWLQEGLEYLFRNNSLITSMNSLEVSIALILLVSIGSFCLVFGLFQSSQVAYIKDIVQAMQEISKGDLSAKVPVLGDDELSYMAAALNAMADDIAVLIERERAAEKSKNELITNVAHDLRTPLTSILGYLELLNSKTDWDPAVAQQYTRIAGDKAKRLQNLIEELFGFTKMKWGRMAVNIATIDIVQLMEQLIDEFYPVFDDKEMTCDYQTDVPSLMIQADGSLIARVFENLVNNATKYGADGKIIRIRIHHENGLVMITVTNYGFVIPKDEIDLIFDKFYRLEHSRASQTGGTGLGLAIAKTIVELHSGSIDVESSLENGTVFTVRLRVDGPLEHENFAGEAAELEEMFQLEGEK